MTDESDCITIDFSEDEYAVVQDAATALGKTVEEYVSDVIDLLIDNEKEKQVVKFATCTCYLCRESVISFMTAKLSVFDADESVCSSCIFMLVRESIESDKSREDIQRQVKAPADRRPRSGDR